MKKLRTAWVAPGEGAMLIELSKAINNSGGDNAEARKTLYRLAIKHGSTDYKTNLAINDEPLTKYDLARITACE